jgi:hypothetical protein
MTARTLLRVGLLLLAAVQALVGAWHPGAAPLQRLPDTGPRMGRPDEVINRYNQLAIAAAASKSPALSAFGTSMKGGLHPRRGPRNCLAGTTRSSICENRSSCYFAQ